MALLLSHQGPAPHLYTVGVQCGSVSHLQFPTSFDDISFIIFAAFREVLRFSKRASMLRLLAPISGAGVGAVLTRWTSLPPELRITGFQASAHKSHKSKLLKLVHRKQKLDHFTPRDQDFEAFDAKLLWSSPKPEAVESPSE